MISLDELVAADDGFFAATAVTDSPFLDGVRYDDRLGVTTESLVIRLSSASRRFIRGIHQLDAEHIFGTAHSGGAVVAAASG